MVLVSAPALDKTSTSSTMKCGGAGHSSYSQKDEPNTHKIGIFRVLFTVKNLKQIKQINIYTMYKLLSSDLVSSLHFPSPHSLGS